MNTWGIDTNDYLALDENGLYQQNRLFGVGRGGGGGANRAGELPAAHVDDLPPMDNTQDNVANLTTIHDAAHPNATTEYSVEFQGERRQGNRVTPNPAQRWVYRGVFNNRDALPGISCQEEADQVRSQIEGLPQYDRLHELDADPTIRLHTPHADSTGRRLETVQHMWARIQSDAEHGTPAADINRSRGIAGPEGSDDGNGLIDTSNTQASLRTRLSRLDRLSRQDDATLNDLMDAIAGGNMEAMRDAISTLDRRAKVGSLRSTTILLHLQRKIEAQNDKNSQRMVRLSGRTNPSAGDREAIQQGNLQRQRNDLILDEIRTSLRANLERDANLATFRDSVTSKLERIDQAGTMWR